MKARKLWTISAICLCLLISGMPSVYSTWYYYANPVAEAESQNAITLGLFDYPEEGLSHTALIEALIGSEKGLNNPNSYLNQQISLRGRFGKDTLGSMAILQGDELNELFNSTNENIAFIVQSVDEDGDGEIDYYYIFTTDVQLGSRGNPVYSLGTSIQPIYRTKVVKNAQGEWEGEETIGGKAPSSYYSETGLGTWRQIPSFNPYLWTAV